MHLGCVLYFGNTWTLDLGKLKLKFAKNFLLVEYAIFLSIVNKLQKLYFILKYSCRFYVNYNKVTVQKLDL